MLLLRPSIELLLLIALLSWNAHGFSVGDFLSKDKKSPPPPPAKPCSQKGVEVFPSKNYSLSLKKLFGKQDLLSSTLNMPVDLILKPTSQKCPNHCKQTNQFKSFVKIKPTSVVKNSCLPKESKEKYQFQKTFKLDKEKDRKKSMLNTGMKMNEWILNTFVYPYLPLRIKPPTKEHKEKIKEACPSCSFHLHYDYVYTKNNQIKMNMRVQCRDIVKPFSSQRTATLVVKNYWKCNPQ